MLLTFVFCVSKQKGMTTKKPEEATYFMAGNSSRICEKIQFILNLILYRWLIALSTLSWFFPHAFRFK